jgi:pimeloyl-ACP methyl ester carboxylesterase
MMMALLLALAIVLLVVPPLYCVLTLSVTHCLSPRPYRSGRVRGLLGLLRESLLQYAVFFRMPVDLVRSRWSDHQGSSGVHFVLLPGYLETDFIGAGARRALRDGDHSFSTYRNTPLVGDLRDQARRLTRCVADLRRRHPGERFILFGHSMGGLIARYAVNVLGCPADAVVAIATPHAGSHFARIGLGACARQMEPGSDFLLELAQAPAARPLFNVATIHDSLVVPRDSAALPADSVLVTSGWCHDAVFFSRDVLDRAIEGGIRLADGPDQPLMQAAWQDATSLKNALQSG